jgi:hypothetical protein
MLSEGQGTDKDPALACAMFLLARSEFQVSFRGEVERYASALEAERTACETYPIGSPEMGHLFNGNFADGIVPTVFDLGDGAFVTIDRTGVRVDTPGGNEHHPVPLDVGDAALPIRYSPVSVVDGRRVRTRHFIEFFVWQTSIDEGHIRRRLEWIPYEIQGTEIRVVTAATILETRDMPYPSSERGIADRERVELRPTADGGVAWAIRGTDLSGVFRVR